MGTRIYKPKEIIAKLRQVEVLTSQGKPVIDMVRSISVVDRTYCLCRQKYGGLEVGQVKRMSSGAVDLLQMALAAGIAVFVMAGCGIVYHYAAQGEDINRAKQEATLAAQTAKDMAANYTGYSFLNTSNVAASGELLNSMLAAGPNGTVVTTP